MEKLTVLAIGEKDVTEWLDDSELVNRIEHGGLMQAVVEKAREYMWAWLDNSDMEADCIVAAAQKILSERR